MRINVGQAKTDLSRLVRVEAGEEVEVARDGVPVARLVAIDDAPVREPGFSRHADRREMLEELV